MSSAGRSTLLGSGAPLLRVFALLSSYSRILASQPHRTLTDNCKAVGWRITPCPQSSISLLSLLFYVDKTRVFVLSPASPFCTLDLTEMLFAFYVVGSSLNKLQLALDPLRHPRTPTHHRDLRYCHLKPLHADIFLHQRKI